MDSFQNIESVLDKKQSWHNFQEIRLSPLWVDLLTKLISLIMNLTVIWCQYNDYYSIFTEMQSLVSDKFCSFVPGL